MKPEIIDAGDGVELVPRHPRDAEETFALVNHNRATLREWLPWVDGTRSIADLRRYAHFVQTQFEHLGGFDYAVCVEGAIVGGIGLHGLDWSNRSGAIGYWLSPELRGRGIVTRAAEALVTHAFERYRVHRIEIRCVVENLKSRAVAERLGFTLEGSLVEAYFLHERFRDIALYATTATRWKASPRS